MKKTERYYAVNNQEDEDGYTLYPDNAVTGENVKRKKEMSPPSADPTTKTGFLKQQQHNFILSHVPAPAK